MTRFRKTAAAMATGLSALIVTPASAEQVIDVPGFADFLAVEGDSVWATNAGRVERWSRSGKLAAVEMARPCGAMAIHAGSLWVADCKENAVVRIDTAKAEKVATIATGIANPKGELNVVAGAGSVWVASDNKGLVSHIDPATNAVIATIAVTPGTHYLVFGFDALWAISSEGKTVQRIDPATGEVTGRVKVGKELKWGDIDTGAGMVWLRTTEDQTFVAIDPKALTVVARLGKAEGSGALRYAGDGLWTSAHDVHTLTWWPQPILTPAK
jgi:hypothetical protein